MGKRKHYNRIWLPLIFLGVLLLGCMWMSGCDENEEKSEYQIYYVNYDKGAIESENFTPESEKTEGMIEEISEKIGGGDEGVGLLPLSLIHI